MRGHSLKKKELPEGDFGVAGAHTARRSNPRVLQVHHFRFPAVAGGVDRVVVELLRALGPHEAVLFEVGGWSDRRLVKKHVEGFTVYRRRLRRPSSKASWHQKVWAVLEEVLTLAQLALLLRRERIDVVHLHTLQDYQEYFIRLSRWGLCRCLLTLHRGETLGFRERSRQQQERWRRILDRCWGVSAVSRSLARLAERRLPMRKRVRAVLNGIGDPAEATGMVGAEFQGESGYALCIGALEHYKGHDIAIEAWRNVGRQYPELELRIVGSGSLERSLRRQAEESHARVRFMGALRHEEVLETLAGASLFLMPSRNEGLGVAVLEAMSLSRPIIASDIPVFQELITDGDDGRLFEAGNAESLSRTVMEVLSDDQSRARLQTSARARFLKRFRAAEMVAGYRQIYREIRSGAASDAGG
ncbi:MAG: glycosyltransferase family 4 protein [Spiribacter salinus]|uniref:Glycosyltransferase family 4 protein n=1 Tax=Spiribacter salinus TaxID=1335746 RepID=A0A540VPL9_9GAMM|nr:MAG: glycosyltransferase family 4 protein [Spiribacter salinus]